MLPFSAAKWRCAAGANSGSNAAFGFTEGSPEAPIGSENTRADQSYQVVLFTA